VGFVNEIFVGRESGFVGWVDGFWYDTLMGSGYFCKIRLSTELFQGNDRLTLNQILEL